MSQLIFAAVLAAPAMASAAERVIVRSFEAGVQGAGNGLRHQTRAAGPGWDFDVDRRHDGSDDSFESVGNSNSNVALSKDQWQQGVFADKGGFVSVVPALAVPEPKTYALMLAGLAIVTLVVVRRRQV